jgi:hypothetical protein
MQDQPVLATWTLILVEHVRSGRGVLAFASDWTYAWSPLLLFRSSLSLLGLSKHRPLICTWAANHFPPWSASPPPSFLLLFFLLPPSPFAVPLASCVLLSLLSHSHSYFATFLPVRLPDFSLYTPSNPTFLSLFLSKYLYGPCWLSCIYDLDLLFYCSFLCLLLSRFGLGFS